MFGFASVAQGLHGLFTQSPSASAYAAVVAGVGLVSGSVYVVLGDGEELTRRIGPLQAALVVLSLSYLWLTAVRIIGG